MSRRLLVAIPAFNEEASLADVLAEVSTHQPGARILVIDDGSVDATAHIARAHGADLLVLPFNVGVGGAMRAAFLYARDRGYDVVVQVDADGQHDPADIDTLVAALDDAAIAIGARFAGTGEYRVRGPRAWAVRLLARTLTRVTGSPLTDTTSGFRASDRRAIELFARHYPAEYLGDTVESLVIASRAGLPIVQIPTSMRARQGGRPSQHPVQATLYLGRAALALVVALTRRRDPRAAP